MIVSANGLMLQLVHQQNETICLKAVAQNRLSSMFVNEQNETICLVVETILLKETHLYVVFNDIGEPNN